MLPKNGYLVGFARSHRLSALKSINTLEKLVVALDYFKESKPVT